MSPARSLADDVRARSDHELRDLLRRRPDLARPAPADLTSLAARASTRASVQRALDSLDRAHLQVLEAAALQTGALDVALLARHLGTAADSGPLHELLGALWSGGLLWRSSDGLHVTRTVGEALGPHVAGLGPPAADIRGTTPAPLGRPGADRRPGGRGAGSRPRHPRAARVGAADGGPAAPGQPGPHR